LPNIADRIEYSKLAASDPNEKLGSNGTLKRGSLGENDSAACESVISKEAMTRNKESVYLSEVLQKVPSCFPWRRIYFASVVLRDVISHFRSGGIENAYQARLRRAGIWPSCGGLQYSCRQAHA
jgi:hypothetical protein